MLLLKVSFDLQNVFSFLFPPLFVILSLHFSLTTALPPPSPKHVKVKKKISIFNF